MFQIHEAIHSKATNNSSLIFNQIKTDKIRKLMTLVHVHLYQICNHQCISKKGTLKLQLLIGSLQLGIFIDYDLLLSKEITTRRYQ